MRALIVEDQGAVAEAIGRVLAREDFETVAVSDARSAEREIRSGGYDLVMLDLRLPDGDGLELCRRLRDEGETVPILMLSGRGGTTDVVRGLEGGADDYLPKPFAPEELHARVRAVLRRRRLGADRTEARPAAEKRAGFDLDRQSRTLTSGQARTRLSRREFDLLVVLLENEGRVRSRAQLLRAAWQLDEDHDKLVDVYVGYLRRKLADVPTLRIETVRGVGYRLEHVDGEA